MQPTTSTHFVSAIASGEGWRDIARNILEQFESVQTQGFQPNIGFLYITEALVPDYESILHLFRTVTGIKHWTGCATLGVCGNGIEYLNVPAISAMIGQLPKGMVHDFTVESSNVADLRPPLEPWLNQHDAMLVIAHAAANNDTGMLLEDIDTMVGGFMVGGISSPPMKGTILSSEGAGDGMSGFVFDADIAVATALSQGCVPIGPLHEISRADDHVIAYLDGKSPIEVFTKDLSALSRQKQESSLPVGDEDFKLERSDRPFSSGDMKGAAHIAFPVTGSDQGDYLVRNIVAIDPENGLMAVSEIVEDGQKIMFVHRDDDTVRADLSQTLVSLHQRIVQERGVFKPRAALYVSCIARAGIDFDGSGRAGGEMALIRNILGDIPLTGFYAGGEISNTRIYGYTGVLTLFL